MEGISAVVYREYLIRRTSLMWLFFDLVVPLLYLLMFGAGFNRAIGVGIQTEGGVVSYNDFFIAGVLSMACFGSAINQSYGFFIDRDNGILFEFLTYPMTRSQFLIGKIIFQCIMSLVQCLLALLVGVWVLGIGIRWEFVPFVFLGVSVGIAAWFFFLAIFAFRIHRNDMFNTVINVAYFVLMFVSSMFYPLDHVPAWLRTGAMFNPLTWHTDSLRYLTIGVGDASLVIFEMLGFGLFLLASFWFAVQSMKKVV